MYLTFSDYKTDNIVDVNLLSQSMKTGIAVLLIAVNGIPSLCV